MAFSTEAKAQAECDKRNAHLKNNTGKDGYVTGALYNDSNEEADEYGNVPITADYEVVPVTMEE
jgi:hypothetical protein